MRSVPIGRLCSGIYDGPHATPRKTERGADPVFLGIANLVGGRLDLSAAEHLSEEDFVAWTRRVRPQEGDIVFSYETNLGAAASIPAGLRCCLGRRLALMRPDQSKADPRFLLYAFLAPPFQNLIRSRTTHGSTVDRIAIKDFPSFEVEVPPLAEQRAIAAILGAFDDKIEVNRRMCETLEAMARALFKSWFIDFDPVRAKAAGRDPGLPGPVAALFPARLVPCELGEAPQGWRVVAIYEAAHVIYGAPFASALFNTERTGEPVIRIRDLPGETPGVWTTEINPIGFKVQPGDVVVGMDGEFRSYLWGGPDGWLNQRVCVFRPEPGWSAAFVRNAITVPLERVEATETATTVIHLGKADIDRFRVILPDRPVADRFNRLCQPFYDRIVAAKRESRALIAARDALLPKLVSGEIRVKQAEKIAQAAL